MEIDDLKNVFGKKTAGRGRLLNVTLKRKEEKRFSEEKEKNVTVKRNKKQ